MCSSSLLLFSILLPVSFLFISFPHPIPSFLVSPTSTLFPFLILSSLSPPLLHYILLSFPHSLPSPPMSFHNPPSALSFFLPSFLPPSQATSSVSSVPHPSAKCSNAVAGCGVDAPSLARPRCVHVRIRGEGEYDKDSTTRL